MPTRKIRDIDPCDKRFNPCRHPEHNPPSMMVYQPGEYEHECPACGHIVRFTVFPHHWLGPERPAVRVEPLGSERHVFYVDVGNIPSSEVMKYIEKVKDTVRDARLAGEDLFIPTRCG